MLGRVLISSKSWRRPKSHRGSLRAPQRFYQVVAGSAAAWPLAARAQTPAGKIYRLGILQPGKPPEPLVDILVERLEELGYREGHNIAYEYRWAEGKPDRLVELAKELVDLKVDVITALVRPLPLLQRM